MKFAQCPYCGKKYPVRDDITRCPACGGDLRDTRTMIAGNDDKNPTDRGEGSGVS